MFQVGDYFEMLHNGKSRGIFKVFHVHLIGRTVSYRPARLYERLWLWLRSMRPERRVLNYQWPAK